MKETLAHYSQDLVQLFGVPCTAVEQVEAYTLPCGFTGSDICRHCPLAQDLQSNTHFIGLEEALRRGGSFTYFCTKGHCFSALVESTISLGQMGLLFGPFHLEDGMLSPLPTISMERMQSLLSVARYGVAGILLRPQWPAMVLPTATTLPQQANQLTYIIDSENQLAQAVRDLDRVEMQRILNELLGHIYLENDYDLEEVKTRCIELVVLVSRAVLDAGVDLGNMFHFNAAFLRQVSKIQHLDSLCLWVSGILHGFMDALFSTTGKKYSDATYQAMAFIRNHWREKPTLEDISQQVFLSKAYCSMLFKQETGMGITEYMSQVRVEHSKKLLRTTQISLASIATECGFHDQSYYTKVFQKQVGISPKKYRNQYLKK